MEQRHTVRADRLQRCGIRHALDQRKVSTCIYAYVYIYNKRSLLVFLFIFLLFIILGMCGQYFAQTPVSSSLDAFELGNTDADELSDVRN